MTKTLVIVQHVARGLWVVAGLLWLAVGLMSARNWWNQRRFKREVAKINERHARMMRGDRL